MILLLVLFFFFKQKTAYEMRISDWGSDVCSSDLDLIDKGEMDFTAAAIRYSDAPDALQGGDLDWRNQNEIPNLFTNVVAAMKAGDISAPVRGPTGFQLIQLIDKIGRAHV